MEVRSRSTSATACVYYDLDTASEVEALLQRGLARCLRKEDIRAQVVAVWDELRAATDALPTPVPAGTVVCAVQRAVDEYVGTKQSRLRKIATLLKSKSSNESDIEEAIQRLGKLLEQDEADGVRPLYDCQAQAVKILRGAGDPAAHCQARFSSDVSKGTHILECPFRPLPCPNRGCDVMMTVAKQGTHDSMCPYKMLPCPQKCTMELRRMDIEEHVSTVCQQKPVACPYSGIGCTTSLVLGTLPGHLVTDCDRHLWLALLVIEEQQQQIKALEGSVATMQAALARFQKDTQDQHAKDMARLNRDLSNVREDIKGAGKEHRRGLDGLRKDIADWKALHNTAQRK
eukprot:comp20514_c0_seq1/m.26249 comp20514_c0_seq1/g.26249  ORF comp20514_c0_seq1/g.26249 comp20514_c0_seq1/m.26249 type:complete len:344 (-) comp20514_c0_seq1:29-1060(-)